METISAGTGNVVDEVFRIFELVMSIFNFLDELSLVRIQGVNRFSRDIVQNTKKFRRRLCLPVRGDEVIDNSAHSSSDLAKISIQFNPLLDWLTAQCFLTSSPFGGPISDRKNTSAFVHVLPHALRGFRKSTASFCGMYITSPPITSVTIQRDCSEASYFQEYTVDSPTGITIADVLTQWFRQDRGLKFFNQPLCLKLPGGRTHDDNGTGFLGKVCRHHDYLFYGQSWYVRQLPEHNKYGVTNELLREWYERTSGKRWWKSGMQEQREFMAKMLEKRKAIAKTQVPPEGAQFPAWPALAWKPQDGDEDGGGRAPYAVEYACGLVFNRQHG